MFAKIVLLSFVLAGVKGRDDLGVKYLMRVYEDCSKADAMPCLKKKAILFFDRAARMESIPLVDGIDVVKTTGENPIPISENEIDATLPRSLPEKDAALTQMLWDRVAAFANSRTIQLSLPKMTGQEIGRGIEEVENFIGESRKKKSGRGKMKKMMGMMMMGAAMKMVAMTPLAIAGLFILAGKALIVAKIALLLSGIMVLKKLMGMKGGGGGGGGGHDSHSHGGGYGGGSSSGWSSGGSSGGWERRSSDLAYNAYKKDQD